MTAKADRRAITADEAPERRMEDVKEAARKALERFDEEAASLKLVFQACGALSTMPRRAS